MKILFSPVQFKRRDGAEHGVRSMEKGIGRNRTTTKLLGGMGAVVWAALLLSACSDRTLDTGVIGSITGAPSPISDNPSPIRGLSGENKEYPNLGSVPPRPTDLRTEAERQKDLNRLAQDRDSAKKRLPTPAAVPAKPTITPGKQG